MSFIIVTDTGGTFTDVIIEDKKGELRLFKSSTTPEDMSKGIFNALEHACQDLGITLKTLLSNTEAFIHGSTTAVNAVIQQKTAKTGFITTKGFRDILVLREGGRSEPFNWDIPYPKSYVPRYLTMEVEERITAGGRVLTPLNIDDVKRAISQLKKYNVEAVGVCLLWSIVNPSHEKKIGDIIRNEWPEVKFTLSHELNPIIREFRRASSTVINASLKPLIKTHMGDLAKRLREEGFQRPLNIISSTGGLVEVDEIYERPILTIRSGPAMLPRAALIYGGKELGANNIILCDTGGTSFDVGVIRDGVIPFTRQTWLGDEFTGHMTGMASIDVKSIGAGGGSIAWIDSGRLLHVGPQSAGAFPGPACYMKGGEEPTVTDASVVIGYINPHYFLGGAMKINADKSAQIIGDKIAKPLGLDTAEAAFSILAACNQNMISALEDMTIKQGVDPRESIMVAGGGAGGMNIIPIARELGVKKLILPATAGCLSAFGGLFSDYLGEFSASFFTESDRFYYEKVNRTLAFLEDEANKFFVRMKVPPGKQDMQFYCEARYPYQVWELDVPLRVNRFFNQNDVDMMIEDFHDVHEKVFSISDRRQGIECINWRVRAIGRIEKLPMIESLYRGKDPSPALKGKRNAYFGETGKKLKAYNVRCYDGNKLEFGNEITGPSIIEHPLTTYVIYPGFKCTVSKFNSYILQM